MAQSVFPRARTALLLVDVINLFDFSRGAAFARRALGPARNIRRLCDRARSDFKAIVADCSRPERAGAPIAKLLEPTPRDFFVLKPHLLGFHDTPLDTLLQSGEVSTLVIAGFAADTGSSRGIRMRR